MINSYINWKNPHTGVCTLYLIFASKMKLNTSAVIKVPLQANQEAFIFSEE
jgi:hypothetical protein